MYYLFLRRKLKAVSDLLAGLTALNRDILYATEGQTVFASTFDLLDNAQVFVNDLKCTDYTKTAIRQITLTYAQSENTKITIENY